MQLILTLDLNTDQVVTHDDVAAVLRREAEHFYETSRLNGGNQRVADAFEQRRQIRVRGLPVGRWEIVDETRHNCDGADCVTCASLTPALV